MDKDVETVGMEIEDEKEIELTPPIQLVIEENNEVDSCIKFCKVIKGFLLL